MASLIPSLNSCVGRMQAGERRVAERLQSHLEDDYLCWYEIPVGKRARYTDFIVLHPGRGLLLLEVKDWKLDTIRALDRATVTLLTGTGLKIVPNPIEQVRQCAYRLLKVLDRDPQLIQPDGARRGKLAFPYGYGVVLSRITRRQFEAHGMDQVMPAHQVLCADEMTESVEAEAFQKRLWDMFNAPFPVQMTLPQIDRVRWHLFPEVRVAGLQDGLFDASSSEAASPPEIPDVIRLMDLQQEQLARSLGAGHRVIHGVAGSGKTMILGYRCLHLARQLRKPILVTCFNIVLATHLRRIMQSHGVEDQVHVYHFHDWCGEQLRRYHVASPIGPGDYIDALVRAVIAAVDKGQIPRAQYGAVMIDEGQDFDADWLRLIVQMLDPDDGSLLLLYDDAQSIYRPKGTLDFALSSVGIQARGRTSILRINYRNTREILDFSYRFARHYLTPGETGEDHVPLVAPEAAGRHGPPVCFKHCGSLEEEIAFTAETLSKARKDGLGWRDVAIACRARWLIDKMAAGLSQRGIPVQTLADRRGKKAFDPTANSVKIMTMHSIKGLEFPMVVIPDVGTITLDADNMASEAKLLYVAMTRAIHTLVLTTHTESEFGRRLSVI